MESSLPHFVSTAPNDVKKEIIDYIKPQQWRYLDQTFENNDSVFSVCFDYSGKLLATGSGDNKARIFDVQQNKEILSFDHHGTVYSVCFDPSGNLLATGSGDNKACIFDVQQNKEIISFNHNGWVKSVCFDHSGNLL